MKPFIRIDASSMKQWACPQWFLLNNIEGLVAKKPDAAMEFGTAMHKSIAAFLSGTKQAEATMLGINYFQQSPCEQKGTHTGVHLLRALQGYFKHYEVGDMFSPSFIDYQGERTYLVELPFALRFRAYDDLDFLLCGVCDSIGTWGKNTVVFKDIKSTASPNIDRYLAQYTLSHQMMVYAWAIKQIGFTKNYPAAIIDGIFLSGAKTYYKRSPLLTYPAALIEEFISHVYDYCDVIHAAWQNKKWKRNVAMCNTGYDGLCKFSDLCLSAEAYHPQLKTFMFTKREYNPAKFNT